MTTTTPDTPPTVLRAGQHPAPLDQVHHDLGQQGLLIHLAMDHDAPLPRRFAGDVAEHAHRKLHGQ